METAKNDLPFDPLLQERIPPQEVGLAGNIKTTILVVCPIKRQKRKQLSEEYTALWDNRCCVGEVA